MSDQHFKPYPKAQKKRRRINRDEWQILRDRVLRRDRHCVVCGVRESESVHHVVPKDYSGSDVAENLLGVCGSGTTRCHGAIEIGDRASVGAMRAVIDARPALRGYVVDTVGEEWLERHYPPLDAGLAAVESGVERVPTAENRDSDRSGARSKKFWGKPIPGWGSYEELEEVFRDCLEILQNMDAPVAKKGGGQAYSALHLSLTDFRDRYREYLKGAA